MKLSGCFPALVTPFRDGEVDFPAFEAFVDWQIQSGVAGVVAVGTTGESATLTFAEHIDVVKAAVRAARGRVPVIAGAGANATAEAIELSVACAEAGAQALLHVTPAYNRPTQEGLVQHYRAIAKSTTLPIIVYNVPSRTACDMCPDTVARLLDVANIVGLKEATGGIGRATELVTKAAARRDFALLSGDDATAMPYLMLGFVGIISVAANVAPAQMVAMCAAATAGNWVTARQWHYRLAELNRLLFVESNPIPAKAVLARMGRMRADVRLPLVEAAPGLAAQLETELSKLATP